MATNAGQFSKSVVTTAGKEMIVQAQNGHTLTFTRVALGDGTLAEGEDMLALTAIKSEKLSADISSFQDKGNGQFQLKFNVNNTTLDTGFWHREIGVMAKIDDGDEELYAYSYAGAAANFLYDKTTPVQERFVNIDVLIGSATDVTVVIDGSVVYPTRAEVEVLVTAHNDSFESHKTVYGAFLRQKETAYALKDVVYLPSLGAKLYLECTTAGTTLASDLVITSPTVGDTVTDGSVVWTIRKIGSGDGSAVGDIKAIAYNGNVQPGWLLCDGSAVSRTMFPDLFDAIGTTYGAGDGSTTFNVPDYNTAERFAQGSTVAGTVKTAGLPNITGTFAHISSNGYADVATASYSGAFEVTNVAQGGNTNSGTSSGSGSSFDASRSSAIYGNSTTVQPNALTCRYIIKAYDGVTPTPAEADISEMLTELTGKANINGSNMTYHKDVITTSGTYTAPATGLYKITVKGGGGGGGGGYHSSNSNAGGGGGGEGGTTITYVKMLIGDSATVVIGAGGAGGAANASGSNGGNSTITVNSVTYTGGGGNAGENQKSGAGGTGTVNGNPGGIGPHASTGLGVAGGAGGGAGGARGYYGSAGASGVSGGGGAGGAGETNGGNAGGAGGDGYVWFEYYTP